jgi:all-trans-retinol dehydrogenase (NAD+)
MKNIKNALVLITGGASGLGRLLAIDFAKRGARVAAWDLNAGALASLEAETRGIGSVTGTVCDVSDRNAVYREAAALIACKGPVDILINNAGVVSGAPLLDTPDGKIVKSIEVNLLASFWTCKAVLPAMIERNRGHIVTISSAAGVIGVGALSDYSASKFGVFGLHESLRMELRGMKSAVRTTVVCPFFTDTGMFHGVKTRIPLLLPILKPEYVVRRIVQSVLSNRKRIILPRFVYSIFLLRLLPTAMLDAVLDFFGINHCMDNFVGRKSV